MRRGHWADRLPAIDVDMMAMQNKLQTPPASAGPEQNIKQATSCAVGRPARPVAKCDHVPPGGFHPGQPLSLTLRVTGEPAPIASVHLHYRHVDQAERWQSVPMEASQGNHKAEIPGDYTNSPYPLQYYFELRRGNAEAWLYPAFNSSLSNQPYYAITHS